MERTVYIENTIEHRNQTCRLSQVGIAALQIPPADVLKQITGSTALKADSPPPYSSALAEAT